MRAALFLLLTACSSPDPAGTIDDPRAMDCAVFKMTTDYAITNDLCTFDVAGLDWYADEDSLPRTVGAYDPGDMTHNNDGRVMLKSGTLYEQLGKTWTGDPGQAGQAVYLGEYADQRCIWLRCVEVR